MPDLLDGGAAPTLVSQAAFAKLHGATPQAVKPWKNAKCLVFIDGLVHVEASDQRMAARCFGRFALDRKGVKQGASSTIKRAKSLDAAPRVKRSPDGDPDLDSEDTIRTLDSFVKRLLAGSYSDLAEATTVKENALALKHVLAARKEAGRVIELQVAKQVLFEEARAARDSWLNWPAKVGTLMAATLGVDADRLIDALATAVHQQLEELGEPAPDFLGADADA